MEKTLSIRPDARIMSILSEILELDRNPENTRNAIFCRAVDEAFKNNDWLTISEVVIDYDSEISVPESLQVKADEEKLEMISQRIKKDLNVARIRTPSLVRLILCNYLMLLRSKRTLVGDDKVCDKNISGSEMVKLLVEMIMMNRSADAEIIESIKQQLVEWRDSI